MSSEPSQVADHYVDALAVFGEQVQRIADHEWDLPTPCVDWDVRQVVAHVVLGEAQLSDLVAGRSGAIGEVDASIVGVSPITAWRGTALAAIDSARSIDPETSIFDHPAGRLSGAQLLGWRISENVVHAWDIGQAIGDPTPVRDDLAEVCLKFWWPIAQDLSDSGDYSTTLEPPAGATAGQRLLALLGRNA